MADAKQDMQTLTAAPGGQGSGGGGSAPPAARGGAATLIKKYANRRLYHTGTSTYVTLEDLAQMVKAGEDFAVTDAKSGEDITRSVLTQIIFEQEGKGGQNLLPITFLRQLIRFYGDSMQALVPSYLEFSIDKFTANTARLPRADGEDVRAGSSAPPRIETLEKQTRANMAVYQSALRMFSPFALMQGG